MLGKIFQPDYPKWEDDRSRTNGKKRASDSNFRQIEQKRQFPLSKEEQQKAVEQDRRPRSIYDLPKQEKTKKSSSEETSSKGKTSDKPTVKKQVTSDNRQSPIKDREESIEVQDEEAFIEEASTQEGETLTKPKPSIKKESAKTSELKEKSSLEEESAKMAKLTESEPEIFVDTEEFADVEEEPEVEEASGEEAMEEPIQAKSQEFAKTELARESVLEEIVREGSFSSESDEEVIATKKEKEKEGESKTSRTEKGNEGSVFTAIQGVGFQTGKARSSQEAKQSSTIRYLAAKIIDKIQVMRRENLTSTIITLRNPPILAGATITLTAADNAKREFNISFANLSPDAKVFLDRKLKEDSLTDSLASKGIIVHTLTTTTEKEKIITTEAQPSRDRDNQGEQQQKRRPFQPPEEEEE